MHRQPRLGHRTDEGRVAGKNGGGGMEASAFSAFHPAMMGIGVLELDAAGSGRRRGQRLRPLPVVGKGGEVFSHPAVAVPGAGDLEAGGEQDWKGKVLERKPGNPANAWRRRRPKLERQGGGWERIGNN